MRKRLVRKTFDMIQELSEREDKEVKFLLYNFGNIVCITFCWTLICLAFQFLYFVILLRI